jgi:transposase
MRKGFDGLCGVVKNEFAMNPMSADVFIFLSKRRDKIKLLQWQGDGFAIFQKRLEKGTFEMPEINCESISAEISPQNLRLILEGIKLSSIRKKLRYEKFAVDKFSKQVVDSATL